VCGIAQQAAHNRLSFGVILASQALFVLNMENGKMSAYQLLWWVLICNINGLVSFLLFQTTAKYSV
jgi:hypothetical protein